MVSVPLFYPLSYPALFQPVTFHAICHLLKIFPENDSPDIKPNYPLNSLTRCGAYLRLAAFGRVLSCRCCPPSAPALLQSAESIVHL